MDDARHVGLGKFDAAAKLEFVWHYCAGAGMTNNRKGIGVSVARRRSGTISHNL
jgi:hypothetical protein